MELKEFTEQVLSDYRLRFLCAIEGLSPEELAWRPNPESNSIAYIVWHVTRVEDRWLQCFAKDVDEVWTRDGWSQKIGITDEGTGIGYTAEQLAQFPVVRGEDLKQYFEDVGKETTAFLQGLEPEDFDFVPERFPFPSPGAHPPPAYEGATISRMFRQLVAEFNQHLGQIQYIRGLQKGISNELNVHQP